MIKPFASTMPLTTMATTTLVIQRHSSRRELPSNNICDGEDVYDRQPANRWTSFGSKQKDDWLICDLGEARTQTPEALHHRRWQGGRHHFPSPARYLEDEEWVTLPGQKRFPEKATGKRANTLTFPALKVRKLRFVFQNAPDSGSGLTELQAWGPGRLPTPLPFLPKEIWPSTPPTMATRKPRPPLKTDTAESPKAPMMGKSVLKRPRSTAGPRMDRLTKQIGWKLTLARRRYSKKCLTFTMIVAGTNPCSYTIQTLKGTKWD